MIWQNSEQESTSCSQPFGWRRHGITIILSPGIFMFLPMWYLIDCVQAARRTQHHASFYVMKDTAELYRPFHQHEHDVGSDLTLHLQHYNHIDSCDARLSDSRIADCIRTVKDCFPAQTSSLRLSVLADDLATVAGITNFIIFVALGWLTPPDLDHPRLGIDSGTVSDETVY